MGLLCSFGHKWKDYACVRKNCTAIQLEEMFSSSELVTLGFIAQFLQDNNFSSVIGALKDRRGDILKKTADMLETIILKGLILAKEKGWEAHSVELSVALTTAAKELASKNPGILVNETAEMDSIDNLIIKVLKTLQASGAVKDSEKERFKQIASEVKTQLQPPQPVEQKKDTSQPKTVNEPNKGFNVLIDDVISKQGRGTYVKGIIQGAGINQGDTAYIVKNNVSVKATKINDIRDNIEAGIRNNASVGDDVVLLLQGVALNDIAIGDILSATETPFIQAAQQSTVCSEPKYDDQQPEGIIKMSSIEKFKGLNQTEKEAYLEGIDRFELIDMFEKGIDEKFDSRDINMLCRVLRLKMISAHEYTHSEFVEKAMLVLSCGNESHVNNYRLGMSNGFIHPDVAERAFDQLINDYKVLITN